MPNLPVPHRVLRRSRTEVPSLRRRYPASSGTPNLSAPPGRPACPSRASGWSSPTSPWGFPCCLRFPCVHAAATTPVQRLGLLFAHSPRPISLPRKGRRVGLHIVLFEACSAFTRVAACTRALSPMRDTLSEGFSHFVTSMTAPIASGWSESCRVGFAPTEERRLTTAHTQSRHRANGLDGPPYIDFPGVGERTVSPTRRTTEPAVCRGRAKPVLTSAVG